MTEGFAASKLKSIYPRELYWLAFQISRKADRIFERFPFDGKEAYVSTAIDGLEDIYALLANAAKLAEILNPGQKKAGQIRSQHLRDLVSGLSLAEVLNKKVRNSIEHFGEYLDMVNTAHSGVASPERYFVAYNLILSHWWPVHIPGVPFQLYKTQQLQYPVYPIRVYVAAERRLFNMDWSVDLQVLKTEAAQITSALQAQFPEERPEDWTSTLFVL